MTPLFKKLNYKAGAVLVLGAPASFEPELAALEGVEILRAPRAGQGVGFALAFAVTQADLDAASRELVARAEGDALLWFAYPKQTSKNYRCEFHRDKGWAVLEAAGYTTVRMVAIDADWSAVRFRKVQYVKAGSR
jgi:hypothetical protein